MPMSLQRKAVSAFIVWHLTAIAIASIPSAPRLGPVRAYLSVTGLAQEWAMFSNPPREDRYWRVRYYIQPTEGRRWIATELIGPAHREDQVRLARSFRASYQDKALELAFEQFVRRRQPGAIRPDTAPGELPDALAPIGRYFARRFAAANLSGTGGRIVRTEVWVGSAANKPVGSPVEQQGLLERRVALLEYADGPIANRRRVPPYPPYHGVEQEADIEWVLEYFEES